MVRTLAQIKMKIQNNYNSNYIPSPKELREDKLFYAWKECVNTKVFNETGFYLDDLPDVDYRIKHDSRTSASKMAEFVIAESKDAGWL